jgi:exodeoxyribonuclease X
LTSPRPRVRVIDHETAGGGPYHVCEIVWQDVEQDEAGVWRIGDARGAHFVNPGRPITPDTMAIHHSHGGPWTRSFSSSNEPI